MVARHQRLTTAIVAVSLLFCASEGGSQPADTPRDRAANGIVMIRTTAERGGSNGTGIIVGLSGQDVYVVTARHVVSDETQGKVSKIEVQFNARRGEWTAATLVDREARGRDIAALRVLLPAGLRAEQVTGMGTAPAGTVARSTDAYAIGYAIQKEWSANVAPDKVSSVGREAITIQSQYVDRGFSGGPLLDTCGRVFGMVIDSTGREADALPIDLVIDVLQGWSLPVSLAAVRADTCGAAVTPTPPTQLSVTEVRRMHRDEQWRDSIPVLTKMIAAQPGSAELFALRSHAYSHVEMPTEALADGQKAVQLAPKSAEAYLRRGEAKHADSRYVEAIADYDKSIELNKNDGETWGNRGSALAAAGDLQKALASLTRAVELQPNRYAFWFMRAGVNGRLKNFTAAVADATRAIELRPDDPHLLTERASAYLGLKQADPALADVNQALRIKPDDPDLLVLRGSIYVMQGRRAAAREDLTHALRLKPAVSHAEDLLKRLDADARLPATEPPARTTPAAPTGGLTYARTLDDAVAAIRNQRNAEAGELLDQLVRLDPARSEAWSLKGALALNVGDNVTAAHEHYEHALARGGTVYFRVAHDHGQDLPPCIGSLALSTTGIMYSSDGGHRFEWPYVQVTEAEMNKFYGVLIGMFHLRVQAAGRGATFNFAAMRLSDQQVVERRLDAELVVGFINRLRQATPR